MGHSQSVSKRDMSVYIWYTAAAVLQIADGQIRRQVRSTEKKAARE